MPQHRYRHDVGRDGWPGPSQWSAVYKETVPIDGFVFNCGEGTGPLLSLSERPKSSNTSRCIVWRPGAKVVTGGRRLAMQQPIVLRPAQHSDPAAPAQHTGPRAPAKLDREHLSDDSCDVRQGGAPFIVRPGGTSRSCGPNAAGADRFSRAAGFMQIKRN